MILFSEDPKSQKLTYKWTDVGVLDYDKETKLYLVHKLDQNGLVHDEEGRPILNGGITPEGVKSKAFGELAHILKASPLSTLVLGRDGSDVKKLFNPLNIILDTYLFNLS